MASRSFSISRIDPVSALKTSLALNLIGFTVWLIAVAILYFVLNMAGIWTKVNEIMGGLGGIQALSFGLIFAVAALAGIVVVIANTILAPLVAVIYNSIVDFFGGISVTLSDNR